MKNSHAVARVLLPDVFSSALVGAQGDIDALIQEVRTRCPQAFHTDATLSERIFFDQPLRDEPHRAFVRHLSKPRV